MPLTGPIQGRKSSGLTAPGVAAAPTHLPTSEQQAIIDAYQQGDRVVVEALAGTGKTTTLKSIAAVLPHRPGIYLAFNKAIVNEARGSFPGRVDVTTAHALAYQAVGNQYGHRLPGKGSRRVPAQRMAAIMKVKAAQLDTGTLNPVLITRMAQATVASYIKSADARICGHHIPPRVIGQHKPADIEAVVLPVADLIWTDLKMTQGKFYFTHDVYMKMWALSNPSLPASYIMFDEAQDSDPVIAQVVGRQAAQLIYVGDQNQAIYGWRGAINAMGRVSSATRLPLTKSFRFGHAVAEAANDWLGLLSSPHRIVGNERIPSEVRDVVVPRAILCRTNGTALGWVLAFQERGVRVALAPGDRNAGKDILKFAWAARDLMKGEGTDHPDLVGFQSWADLLAFVDEEEDTADLKRLVGIINRIGYPAVIDAIKNLTPEQDAQVTVSTAHKAKGLEWDSVKVADDFLPPEEDKPVDPADLMLAYVTVTRAKLLLDPGSLGEPKLWKP